MMASGSSNNPPRVLSFVRVHQHVIVLRPLQSLVSSPLELTVTRQPVTDPPQRAVIHILADIYISAQVVDVDDKPDWSKEFALRDASVDGSPFRHDVSKLGALSTPAQEGSRPPHHKVRDAHAAWPAS